MHTFLPLKDLCCKYKIKSRAFEIHNLWRNGYLITNLLFQDHGAQYKTATTLNTYFFRFEKEMASDIQFNIY